MTKDQLAAATLAFEQKGGQVKVVSEGQRTVDPTIRYCKCGCEGNWTEHTMRAGESGRHSY